MKYFASRYSHLKETTREYSAKATYAVREKERKREAQHMHISGPSKERVAQHGRI